MTADGRGDPGDELVEVVDPDTAAVVDVVPRRELRARRLWHRVAAVLVRDPDGRLYVHRRTESKDVFPGAHDVWAGGVMAPGEAPEEAAVRELAEELGVTGVPLSFLGTARDDERRALWWLYEVTWDGPVAHQPTEVADGWWETLDGLRAQLADPAWSFVPDGREMLEAWLEGRLRR